MFISIKTSCSCNIKSVKFLLLQNKFQVFIYFWTVKTLYILRRAFLYKKKKDLKTTYSKKQI